MKAKDSIVNIKREFLYKTNLFKAITIRDDYEDYKFSQITKILFVSIFLMLGFAFVIQHISPLGFYKDFIGHWDWIVKSFLVLALTASFIGFSASGLGDLLKGDIKKNSHLHKYFSFYVVIFEIILTVMFFGLEFLCLFKGETTVAKILANIEIYSQLIFMFFPIVIKAVRNRKVGFEIGLTFLKIAYQASMVGWNLMHNSHLFIYSEKYQKIISRELETYDKKDIDGIKKELLKLIDIDKIGVNVGYFLLSLITLVSLFFGISIKNIVDFIIHGLSLIPNYLGININVYILVWLLGAIIFLLLLWFVLILIFRRVHAIILEQIIFFEQNTNK